ncbi:MAG: transposase, partial [Verrucomicrobiota bacterium]|nr:transposase [Verrucomicrobiota bacterium]
FSVIPIQLTKAVVENGSDVGPFSPLPIHLCALCDLCGIPPHPDPKTFSDSLYLQRQWQRLTLFLRQPGAPIDNNGCERALKKPTLHRKNSLFNTTRSGARLGDLYLSIIYTCRLNQTNAFHTMTTLSENQERVVANPQQ